LVVALLVVAGTSAYVTLKLIIKSTDTVVVPDLIGKDAVKVLEILTDLGLNTKVSESEFSSEYPRDQIIFQDPEPGSEVKGGRDVKVIVSRGTHTVALPDMVSSPLRQARILLAESGLCLGNLSYTHSEKYKKDRIIAQVPAVGAALERGDCVAFLVSLGRRLRAIMMPDLLGLTPDDAILEIEMSNLALGEIGAYYQDDAPIDTIIGQKPLSGYRVVEGSPVQLIRNRPVGREERDAGETAGAGHLFRYRLGNGFLRKRVRIEVRVSGISTDLFHDFVRPDEEIWRIIPRRDGVKVSLYEDDKLVSRHTYDAW